MIEVLCTPWRAPVSCLRALPTLVLLSRDSRPRSVTEPEVASPRVFKDHARGGEIQRDTPVPVRAFLLSPDLLSDCPLQETLVTFVAHLLVPSRHITRIGGVLA